MHTCFYPGLRLGFMAVQTLLSRKHCPTIPECLRHHPSLTPHSSRHIVRNVSEKAVFSPSPFIVLGVCLVSKLRNSHHTTLRNFIVLGLKKK